MNIFGPSRKTRLRDLLFNRCFELHNEISDLVIKSEQIDWDKVELKKDLLKKYKRKYALVIL